jgi:hypothetical protein
MKISRKTRFARKKKSAACHGRPRPEKYVHDSVAIVVVIVVIPIAIGMPPVAVFIPPAMSFVPAAFPRFMQFVARMIGLPAIPAVMLHGFMQFVIRLGDAPLALVVIFGGRSGCSRECQHANECCSS